MQRRVGHLRRHSLGLAQQPRQIEPVGEHRELAVGVVRPLYLGPVPIKLDAVVVGIAQNKP